jgi:AraC-like DNA-binding protein
MPRTQHSTARFEQLGFDLYSGPAVLMVQPHRHNDIEMTLLKKGWIDYLFGGVRVRIPAGALCVRWAAIPHQSIAMKQASTHYSLKLPFAWFMRWDPPQELVKTLLGGRMVIDHESAEGCTDEAMFHRWSALFRQKGGEPGHIVALEAEARLRRAALRLGRSKRDSTTRATARAQLGSVERMTIFIAENYTRPLAIDEIAQAARLHPNSAMRLFRRSCGVTLLDYVNMHRIWHAQRLLNARVLKTRELARQCGYGSPARFYAAFRKVTGQTPREYLATLGR